MTTDLSNALDNLALATTSDRDVLQQLITANATLTEANKCFAEQLKQAVELLRKLDLKVSSLSTAQRFDPRSPIIAMSPFSYFNPFRFLEPGSKTLILPIDVKTSSPCF